MSRFHSEQVFPGRVVVSTTSARIRVVAAVVGFAMLTALAAQVRIPIPGTGVPMTLQGLAVLLTGFCLGFVPAVLAMLLYVAAGVAGLPVFAPASVGLYGVTGGYIFGFVLGAGAVSVIRGRSRGAGRLFLAGAVGTAVIFAAGVAWQVGGFDVPISQALRLGVLPFLPKAAAQLAVAVAAVSVFFHKDVGQTCAGGGPAVDQDG